MEREDMRERREEREGHGAIRQSVLHWPWSRRRSMHCVTLNVGLPSLHVPITPDLHLHLPRRPSPAKSGPSGNRTCLLPVVSSMTPPQESLALAHRSPLKLTIFVAYTRDSGLRRNPL